MRDWDLYFCLSIDLVFLHSPSLLSLNRTHSRSLFFTHHMYISHYLWSQWKSLYFSVWVAFFSLSFVFLFSSLCVISFLSLLLCNLFSTHPTLFYLSFSSFCLSFNSVCVFICFCWYFLFLAQVLSFSDSLLCLSPFSFSLSISNLHLHSLSFALPQTGYLFLYILSIIPPYQWLIVLRWNFHNAVLSPHAHCNWISFMLRQIQQFDLIVLLHKRWRASKTERERRIKGLC